MPSDVASYLASRYLVSTPTKHSQRKRKRNVASGLHITDDDDGLCLTHANAPGIDDGDDSPVVVAASDAPTAGLKSKQVGWKPVGSREGKSVVGDDEREAADAIIAATISENKAARDERDAYPVVDSEGRIAQMSDGTYAGLQSAAAVAAQLRTRQREEKEEFERYRKAEEEQETVYRDATGRRIDLATRRAQARQAAAEARQKETLAKEALKGSVQSEQARERREQLKDAKLMSFARTADDVEMNKDLKETERWNDPMMQFLAGKKTSGPTGKSTHSAPAYSGAAPPNRYGIKPGYRWDGVVRGNGFEAERFKAINRRERNRGLEYSWQMDD